MVTDVYLPRVNGVSTSIQTFRREFRALGHEVLLIAPDYGLLTEDEQGLIRVPALRVPLDPEDRFMRWRRLRNLLPRLAGGGFDLVHIQTPFLAHYAGVAFSNALDVPRVETYHTYFEEYFYHYVRFLPKQSLKGLARRLSRGQCNDLDGLVVPSHQMRTVLEGYGISVPMEVIPTGLDLDEFASGDREAFRRRYSIPPERPVIAYVGRVAFEKNIDFLLRVTARLKAVVPDILFVVSGEGPALTSLKEQARHLGLEAHALFVGYLDRRGPLLDCYRAADVFIFASRTETQGLVLLEAMALGTPVVSTAIMGTRDMLRQGAGAVIVPEDESAFAAAVADLLRDEPRRRKLGAAGQRHAKQWTARPMAERLLAFYRGVIDTRRPARPAARVAREAAS
jgi:glycosyltransferase involved in cell wall biosynthesis